MYIPCKHTVVKQLRFLKGCVVIYLEMILAKLRGLGFLEDVLVRGGEVEPGRGALAAQRP